MPLEKKSQKVPTFLKDGKEVSVPSVSFRTQLCPQDFYKINQLPIAALCGARGIRLIAYLDYFLVLARRRQELCRHTNMVLDILDQVGFQRNPKKCHLTPRQRFDYLGLQLDSRELRVFLPQKKISGLNRFGLSLLRNPTLNQAFSRRIFLPEELGRATRTSSALQMAMIKGLHSDNFS